ncbi:hypothetical protein [Vibrio genomosp. F10]|uniref:hypothetical protein n=1 Tax=Vibrio genomosp. F10 TaxID=723171 RepID=UPI0002E1C4AA|nr:hypothetical protein [Vibrio genomosp. F10]OEE82396.1 hypothetical protein A1QK_20610 [Vibrio genomosp. F10 str. 9ZD137]
MKYILLITTLLMVGCGGSSSPAPPPTIDPPDPEYPEESLPIEKQPRINLEPGFVDYLENYGYDSEELVDLCTSPIRSNNGHSLWVQHLYEDCTFDSSGDPIYRVTWHSGQYEHRRFEEFQFTLNIVENVFDIKAWHTYTPGNQEVLLGKSDEVAFIMPRGGDAIKELPAGIVRSELSSDEYGDIHIVKIEAAALTSSLFDNGRIYFEIRYPSSYSYDTRWGEEIEYTAKATTSHYSAHFNEKMRILTE